MYPEDRDFHFYNSENDGYRGGFGDYQEPAGSNQPPQNGGKKKKNGGAGRTVALILACAIAGGAAGVGGAAAYNHFAGVTPRTTTVIYQNTEAPAQSLANNAGGGAMTPEQLYKANVDSCVGITVSTTTTNYWGYTSTSAASGSGFVLTEDGYIVTNYHVVEDAFSDNTVTVEVSFQDGSSYPAKLVGGEPDNDVAVLKIEASGLQPVVLGDSDTLAVGQTVMAIGNPLGELDYSLTDGIVSALDRLITTGSGTDSTTMNMLQTNCAINPGNSGGPLFDSYGKVIGITTAKYATSASGTGVEGLGFAVPINDVKELIADIVQFGYVTGKPYMGITMQSVPQNAQMYGVSAGAYIMSVAPGSCAEKAGLQQGDIIVAVDETTVDSSDALKAAVGAYRAGDSAKLTVIRQNQPEKLELTITFDEENDQTTAANQSAQQPVQQQPQYQQPQGGFSFGWPFGSFFY